MNKKLGWPKKMEFIYDISGETHPIDQKIIRHTTFINNKLVMAHFFTRNSKINQHSIQEMRINNEKLIPEQIKMFFEWVADVRKEVAEVEARKK